MTGPGAWPGGTFGERARCVLAPNPNMMTLDGTNTWVLREPGSLAGPWSSTRARRWSSTSTPSRRTPVRSAVVLLTHGHPTTPRRPGSFAERMGCGVRALDPRTGSATRASATATWSRSTVSRCTSSGRPGTPSDSLSFVLPQERAVLTGDTVLGRGTTVVAHPDGQLGAYLDSLRPAARARRGAGASPRSGPGTAR